MNTYHANLRWNIALNKLRALSPFASPERLARLQRRYLVTCWQIECAEGRHAQQINERVPRHDLAVFEFERRLQSA